MFLRNETGKPFDRIRAGGVSGKRGKIVATQCVIAECRRENLRP